MRIDLSKPESDTRAGSWTTIVGPQGQVKTLLVKSNVGGDVPVQWNPSMEQPEIPKRYREAGWKFYSEICEEDEDSERGALHARLMANLERAFASGKRPKRGELDTDKFYHPAILAMRANDRPDSHRPMDLEDLFGDDALAVMADDKQPRGAKRGRKAKADA